MTLSNTRVAKENRAAFLDLLYAARDLAPTEPMIAQLGLGEAESAWVIDSMRLLQALGARCGVVLCPYGWWDGRATPPNYTKFKQIMPRVFMQALIYSKSPLDFG